MGIVSAIMLRRRHFSLIQGFFFFLSYQVCREKDTKQAYMRLVRKLRITAWTKIPHSLKSQQKRWGSSSLFRLAVLLQEGHFFVWCVCSILRCLPLYVGSDLNELYHIYMKLIPNKTSLSCSSCDTLYSTQNKRKTLWTCEAF